MEAIVLSISCVALFEVVAAAERNVADVGDAEIEDRGAPEDFVIGADPFDRAQGAGPEAGAGPVAGAEVHRHADERDVETGKIGRRPVDTLAQAPQAEWESRRKARFAFPCGKPSPLPGRT